MRGQGRLVVQRGEKYAVAGGSAEASQDRGSLRKFIVGGGQVGVDRALHVAQWGFGQGLW